MRASARVTGSAAAAPPSVAGGGGGGGGAPCFSRIPLRPPSMCVLKGVGVPSRLSG